MEYNTKKHAVYLLTYHMVFVTKYRRPFISDEMGNWMKEYAAYLLENAGGALVSAETDRNHIHLLVSLPPDTAPTAAVTMLKTMLSKKAHANPAFMAQIRRYLYGDVPMWSASYFVASTGSVSLETVKQYIESQRTEEHQKRKYEKSGKYSKRRL